MTSAVINKLRSMKTVFILVTMLITLHISIWYEFGNLISRSFMLSHLGLFLLWQPVWRGDEKLSLDNAFLFIVFTLTFTFWLNNWLLFAWLIILIGFISGRGAYDKNERITLLLALAFLVLQLLFAAIPRIAKVDISHTEWFYMLLPVIPVLMLFFPSSPKMARGQIVDFIHALTTAMLTALVSLGSVLTMFISQSTYFIALTQTTLVIGLLIICISWLLTSRSEFSGILQLWSSYMLNIGTPFEQWLSELSRLNEQELDADDFLSEAMKEMVKFSWISGVSWTLDKDSQEAGSKTDYFITIESDNFTSTIFIYGHAGTALKLHSNLLIRLLDNFYTNKLRENELTKQAQLKAIYETGARITHDIKNLLQSFQAITSIVATESSESSESSATQRILKRQLPNLTQRLQLALDKLQAPDTLNQEKVFLKDWWRDLKKRDQLIGVQYQADIQGDPRIPVDLFDSVADNLVENVGSKMMSGTNVRATITLKSNEDQISFTVCDSGAMIPKEIIKDLLHNPVKSDNGLGIGLFQAARHAQLFGYKLEVIHNQPGRVCFELRTDENQGSRPADTI